MIVSSNATEFVPVESGNKQSVKNLFESKAKISSLLGSYKEELELTKKSKSLRIDWILHLADNITLTDTTLPSWTEGMPLIKSHPPAPQPEEMRDSLLQEYHFEFIRKSLSNDVITDKPYFHHSTLATINKLNKRSMNSVDSNKRNHTETVMIPQNGPSQTESNQLLPGISMFVEKKARKVEINFESSDSESE